MDLSQTLFTTTQQLSMTEQSLLSQGQAKLATDATGQDRDALAAVGGQVGISTSPVTGLTQHMHPSP